MEIHTATSLDPYLIVMFKPSRTLAWSHSTAMEQLILA